MSRLPAITAGAMLAVCQAGCIYTYWPWERRSYEPPPLSSQRLPEPAEAEPRLPSPPRQPAPTPEELRAAEARRQQAEQFVASLAGADEPAAVRIEADLLAVGQEAVLPLKMAELSADFDLRRRAARIGLRLRWKLACRTTPTAPLRAAEIMSGQDARARADVVDQIVKVAVLDDLPFLRECLADRDGYIRQQAVDGLVRVVETADFRGKARARAEVGPVLASAAVDEDRSIRLLAIAAMTKTATVDVDRMIGLLDSADLETRTAAIEALGQSGSAAARKRLAPLLADPQWRIRAAALEALAQFAPPAWRVDEVGPRILEMLADPDEFVRSRAAPLLTGWVERSNGGAATDLIVAAAPPIRCSREVLLWLCDLLLDDRSSPARSAAYLALIAATGQKMAFDSEALPLIRQVQAKAWRDWVSQNARPMARPEDRPGQG